MKKILIFSFLFITDFAFSQSYSTLLHKHLSQLTVEQVKQTMLTRLNEMRAEVKQKPLLYNDTLETVAFHLMDHKTIWFEADGNFVATCHFDDDNNGVFDRFKLFHIEFDKVVVSEKRYKSGTVYTQYNALAGEIVAESNGSVFSTCEAWRNSPTHWKQITQKYYTHVGIAFRKGHPVVICDFVKFKPVSKPQSINKH